MAGFGERTWRSSGAECGLLCEVQDPQNEGVETPVVLLAHDVLPVAKMAALGGVLLVVGQPEYANLVAKVLGEQNSVQARVDVVRALEGSKAQPDLKPIDSATSVTFGGE